MAEVVESRRRRAISFPQRRGVSRPRTARRPTYFRNLTLTTTSSFLDHSALCNESSPSLKSSVPAPPSLVPNLITLLESLITMPTHASELNSWWGSTPIVIKKATSSNGNSSKKRKLSSMAKDDQHDGSTGVFDSSSSASEGEYDAAPSSTKLSSRDAKKLLPPLLSLPAHKRVFQDAYLALLALPTMASDESSQKRVLSMLHRQVLPHMTDPRRLMDWLVDCVGQGECL